MSRKRKGRTTKRKREVIVPVEPSLRSDLFSLVMTKLRSQSHKTLHPAAHYMHMIYLGMVSLGGPYAYAAGVLLLIELIGTFLHEEV